MTLKELKIKFPAATLETWHQHENGGGWVENTVIVSGTARVEGSAIVAGTATVEGTVVVAGVAIVAGSARVSGSAVVAGVAIVKGYARVSGSARVIGGIWKFSPFQIQGSRYFLTVSSHTEITVGCETHDFEFWREHYTELGEKHQYTKNEIAEYSMMIRLAVDWAKLKLKNEN